MSIEVISLEELKLENVNEKTAMIAEGILEYFKDNWGIRDLKVSIDGNDYETKEENLNDDPMLFEFCKNIKTAKNISFVMNSDNSASIYWKEESSFIKYFDDDVKDYVDYKCIEYYDTDPGIETYAFGKSSIEKVILETEADFEQLNGVEAWFSYTPEISLTADDEHPELYDDLIALFDSLYALSDSEFDEDDLPYDDYWKDDNELIAERAIRIRTENLYKFVNILNELILLVSECDDIEYSVELGLVPDDAGKDSFLALNSTEVNDKTVFELLKI